MKQFFSQEQEEHISRIFQEGYDRDDDNRFFLGIILSTGGKIQVSQYKLGFVIIFIIGRV